MSDSEVSYQGEFHCLAICPGCGQEKWLRRDGRIERHQILRDAKTYKCLQVVTCPGSCEYPAKR